MIAVAVDPKYIKYFNEFILLYLTKTLIFSYRTIKESSLFLKTKGIRFILSFLKSVRLGNQIVDMVKFLFTEVFRLIR